MSTATLPLPGIFLRRSDKSRGAGGHADRSAFNWHALGVPKNQMNCFLQDGSVEDFVKATLDPVPSLTTLRVSLPME